MHIQQFQLQYNGDNEKLINDGKYVKSKIDVNSDRCD